MHFPPSRKSHFIQPSLALLLVVLSGVTCFSQSPDYSAVPPVEPPYYRVRYEGPSEETGLAFPVRFAVWIPENVRTLRGVVVHQHGCGVGSCKSGLTGAFDLHWQALAQKHKCALLSAAYEQPGDAECALWCDPRNGSDGAFQMALADLGKQSGHDEMNNVPWALWGHSGGGLWAGGMTLLHPERVAAVWLRSGVPLVQQDPDRRTRKPFPLPEAALDVPIMCNLGTKEGFSDQEGRFKNVWPANKILFTALRERGGLIGIAVDPVTGHECGNQRYLAIPWLDACLTARLPTQPGGELRSMPAATSWLADSVEAKAVSAEDYAGDPLQAIWLPSKSVAESWMQYVHDTRVSDPTPPPPPTNVEIAGDVIRWDAKADLESGMAHFLIYRDDQLLAKVTGRGKTRFGRSIFQGLQYSDTPEQPLIEMTYQDERISAEHDVQFQIISVNSAGLRSSRSANAIAGR